MFRGSISEGLFFLQRETHSKESANNSARLRLNFDQAKTNHAMTHVMVLSAKVRRSERLK
jgi:hypothetical protein